MAQPRTVRIMSITPEHPRKGPSKIIANIELAYLKDAPLAEVELTPDDALRLAEDLIRAVRITARRNVEKGYRLGITAEGA